MITKIDLPVWFKYTYDDFDNKNKEVWAYVENLKFAEIIELYYCCVEEEQIKTGIADTVYQQFSNYEKDINSFATSKQRKLYSFNSEVSNLINHCIKRNNISEPISQDLQNLNKIEAACKNVEKVCKTAGLSIKSFGKYDPLINFEFLNQAKKLGELWLKEKQVLGDLEIGDDAISKLFEVFPKTFEYVRENKLGWNLGGWSGGN